MWRMRLACHYDSSLIDSVATTQALQTRCTSEYAFLQIHVLMMPSNNLQLFIFPKPTMNLSFMIIPPVLPRKRPLRPTAVSMSTRKRKCTNVLPKIMSSEVRDSREVLLTIRVCAKEVLDANGAESNGIESLASLRSLWNRFLGSTDHGLLVLVGW